MLDEFTPAEFDERLAAEHIDGSPPEWVERLAAILKTGFAFMAMAEVDPDAFDPLRPRHNDTTASSNPFEPTGETTDKPASEQAPSPNQLAAMFATTYGPADKG